MRFSVLDLTVRLSLDGQDSARVPVDLWSLDLDRATPQWAVLSAEETARARRFHFAHDQHRFAVRRSWLRVLLGGYLHCSAAEVPLLSGAHGKPELAGDAPWQFNLTSAESLALCAVTVSRRIGIDLERVRPFAWEAIAARVFTPTEQALLERRPPADRLRCFFRLWTAHEALVKADGCGLGGPVLAVDCAALASGSRARLQDKSGTHWDCLSLAPRAGWVATLAIESS